MISGLRCLQQIRTDERGESRQTVEMDEIVSTGGDPREAGLRHMIDRVDLVVGEDRDRLRETGEDHLEAAVEGSVHYSVFSTLFEHQK